MTLIFLSQLLLAISIRLDEDCQQHTTYLMNDGVNRHTDELGYKYVRLLEGGDNVII